MKAMDRKLLRDLWGMKGQALAIAMVIVSGVATLVISLSTLDSLRETRAAFYREHRFADLFASLKRAPESVAEAVRAIPGMGRVQTRVVAAGNLDVPGFHEPVRGLMISLPREGEAFLNSLHMKEGRLPAAGSDDEAAVSDLFALAHGLRPGDRIGAVINGKRETFRIVGIGLSPEYVYQVAPGSILPDSKRYGLLWIGRDALAAAHGMEGAFNDVVATLSPDASPKDVLRRLDVLLAPYGGLGAYGREDQVSHRYLSEEFRGLSNMASIFPVIFLGVAAFLLNVSVNRLVSLQRDQIGTLKAFGWTDAAVGAHYVKLVALIAVVGVAGGLAAGAWLGRGMTRMYMDFYRFPRLEYELRPFVAAVAALVSMAAARVRAGHAGGRAPNRTPAAAKRAAPPGRFRVTLAERLGLRRFLSQPARMIVRNIGRRPVKSTLSVLGIGLACGILVLSGVQGDAIDYMVDVHFRLSQREDTTVAFVEPASSRALYSIRSMAGVRFAEPYRTVSSRIRFGHRERRIAIQGLEREGRLHRVLDTRLHPVPMPEDGLLLTDYLAGLLGVRAGDRVTVEILEGDRRVLAVPVAGLVREFVGTNAYMEIGSLNRLLGEGDAVSGVFLSTDPAERRLVYDALKGMPRVAGTAAQEDIIRTFYETMGGTFLVFTFVITALAGTIALGVVYNSARIALSERSRELASLRVLGFTRGEISYILLGELAVLIAAGIPSGFLLGKWMAVWISRRLQSDLFRVPFVMEPSTYGFAAVVVIVSALLSALLVRRRLDRLDLVAVLKARE
jgi:putative ABC transport system permease protein